MNEQKIVDKLKSCLGDAGINHFQEIKDKHGGVMASWNEGGIPYITHFREGMWVRNRLRDITNLQYTDHWYDENWARLVELCLV